MTVLIAGCGDLGIEAGRRFIALGHRVIGVRRTISALPDEFDRQSVDLRTSRPDVPRDTDIVVVCLTAGERSAEAYRATYLEGLRHVLDAVDDSDASPRVLLVSSTAVYDVDDGSWVDERTPATSTAPTAAVLIETEQLLAERSPGSIALRLGGIYGPGRELLIGQVREGRAGYSARPLHTNRIHRDDAAAAIVHLTTAVADPAPVYLGIDDDPAPFDEVIRFLAAELDVAPPAAGAETTRAAGGDKRCSNALLRGTGFEFTYPDYRAGYRALIAASA